ncbi:MAG: DNA-3-methyladenine glycosylase [Candidatus Marinimicrobia bacterium]|nr:DNA-3-methyladenine glycosylase [Candidatus Neomarinimicrobiota bacterium]
MISSEKYYLQDSLELAQSLIGKYLVREINNQRICGKIVETEAYLGINDKASHTHNGKKTKRTKILYKKGGLVYVYTIYGIYHCFNIVANRASIPQAVFIRALEPVEGQGIMENNRKSKIRKTEELTNGPAKLCQALKLNKTLYGLDLKQGKILYLEEGEKIDNIVKSPRINVDYAEEDKNKPWRFYEAGNPYVSRS